MSPSSLPLFLSPHFLSFISLCSRKAVVINPFSVLATSPSATSTTHQLLQLPPRHLAITTHTALALASFFVL